MLGALSLKWKWRQRREADGKPTDNPNLVFGGDVHVVWEKFCRYFDVEPRIVPLQPGKYTIGPEDIEPHVDENTIGVAAVVGTTFTGHADDVVGINDFLVELKDKKGLDVPLHIDGASGAFVWPFLYPHSEWDFRLEQVRSINASGHKFGLVYPGIGWLIFREKSDLAEDLVFYENYLGKTDATFTLNFSTGSVDGPRPVLQLRPLRQGGLPQDHGDHAAERGVAGQGHRGHRQVPDHRAGEETLPLVAFNLAEQHPYDEFDIAFQLAAERGWMVPAYTMPPNAQDVKMMRALVKLTLSRSLVDTLDRRHRRGNPDARGEGAGERVGAQAREDQRHPLSGRLSRGGARRPPAPRSPDRPAGSPAPRRGRRPGSPASAPRRSRARPGRCRRARARAGSGWRSGSAIADSSAARPPGRSRSRVNRRTRRPAAVSWRVARAAISARSMLPPDRIATVVPLAAGSTTPAISAATPTAPAPSTSSFERSSRNTIASAMGSSATVTRPLRCSSSSGPVICPWPLTAMPSAMVCSGSVARTPRPPPRPAAPAPRPRPARHRPPATTTRARSGTSVANSRPTPAWPAITSQSS